MAKKNTCYYNKPIKTMTFQEKMEIATVWQSAIYKLLKMNKKEFTTIIDCCPELNNILNPNGNLYETFNDREYWANRDWKWCYYTMVDLRNSLEEQMLNARIFSE